MENQDIKIYISKLPQGASKDQEKLVGEKLVERACKEHGVGCEIVYGPHGKPYLKDGRVFFNLSHSHGAVVCAVAKFELGCDIEKIRPIGGKVGEKFFATSEKELLSACTSDREREALFFRLWTLKESLVKATGDGLYKNFHTFSISFDEFGNPMPVISDGREYHFFEPKIMDGYSFALCSEKENGKITTEIVDFD